MIDDLLVLHLAGAPASTADDSPTSPQPTVRPVSPADRDALASLYLASYPADIGAEDLPAAAAEIDTTLAGGYGELLGGATLVAELGGRPVGAVLTTTGSIWDDDLDGPFVIDLFVEPSVRGRGVGRALLLHAVDGCRAAGRTSLALRVGAGTSPAAWSLYQRTGFRPRPVVVPDRDPDAVHRILTRLPDWFGVPASIDRYVADAADHRFSSLLARQDESTTGVALLRRHFPEAAELHLIAVDPTAHRRGTGRALVQRACSDLAADGCRFLTVHTVGPSYEHVGYARTRAFYRSVGFVPLEEHDGLDWAGPTLVLARSLA